MDYLYRGILNPQECNWIGKALYLSFSRMAFRLQFYFNFGVFTFNTAKLSKNAFDFAFVKSNSRDESEGFCSYINIVKIIRYLDRIES